jgi:YVTN family beta-propeller protein
MNFLLKQGIALLILITAGVATPYAYVTNPESSSIYIIDLASNALMGTILLNQKPTGIAIRNDHAYVLSSENNTVMVIDLLKNAAQTTILVGKKPVSITIYGDQAFVVNAEDKTISVIDLIQNAVKSTIPVTSGAAGIAIYAPMQENILSTILPPPTKVLPPLTEKKLQILPAPEPKKATGMFLKKITETWLEKVGEVTLNGDVEALKILLQNSPQDKETWDRLSQELYPNLVKAETNENRAALQFLGNQIKEHFKKQ